MPLHGSPWFANVTPLAFPKLWGDREVDVVVIGGGITGLTAATLFKQAGMRVAVLEARKLGLGVTGGTSAHLTAWFDTQLATVRRKHGDDSARMVWDTGMAAIDQIERLTRDLSIPCEFARIPGALYAAKPGHRSYVDQQIEAVRDLGIRHEALDTLPELPYAVHRAVRFPDQARFHAIKYLYGLAQSFSGVGCEIFENTRALHIDPGSPCLVTTEDGQITAKHVFIATHSPIGWVTSVHTRLAPYRSYCIDVDIDGQAPDGLYWDSEEPYNYIRRSGKRLIIGGRDHKTGHGDHLSERFEQLEAYARQHFKGARAVHRWSAQVFEPADGLPYIGAVPAAPNVYMATGFSGNGLTMGTASAMIVRDLILDHANPWARLYDPKRLKPLSSATNMLEDNIDVAFRFIADRLAPDEAKSLDAIPPGEGRTLTLKGKKVAAYREPDGELHVMSAVCSHAGCIVKWNDAETSWDCPCHGGRYNACGQVLDGPPVRDLDSPSRGALVFGLPGRKHPAP